MEVLSKRSRLTDGQARNDSLFLPMPGLPWFGQQGLTLWRINQLTRFWESSQSLGRQRSLWDSTCNLVRGLAQPFGFLMLHQLGNLSVAWVSLESLPLKGQLEACYPGISLASLPGGFARFLGNVKPYSSALLVGGYPSVSRETGAGHEASEPLGLDALVQGLKSFDWLYSVLSFPVPETEKADELRRSYAAEKEFRAAYLRPGTALETNNPAAKAALKEIENFRERIEEGLRIGLWRTAVVLFLRQREALTTAASILRALFSGKDSPLHSVNIGFCLSGQPESTSKPDPPVTVLNSRDAARYLLIPSHEYQGYPLRPLTAYDVHQAEHREERSLFLGTVFPDPYSPVLLPLNQLPRHLLIAGTTGSGKTNTCLFLLHQAWKTHRIPFLVLETSEKTEYGARLKNLLGEDLEVFTVGDESRKPLHLDFVHVPAGMHVEAHMGHLMQIFKAAFTLPPPTPYLLEEALHLWYIRSGWNLERNERSPVPLLRFTDLTEILRELLEVKYVHYGGELRGIIDAALLARLSSLTRGGVGRFLNGTEEDEAHWGKILHQPVVLQFDTITDTDQKSLVILFLLYRLMTSAREEQRRSADRLHLTVIEEAHQVLSHREPSQHPDAVDTRAAVVESFANALAEVRHSGEGLIILDQMPSLLTPSVRSNTNMKLVHRLPTEEEQRPFAQSAVLTTEQRQHFSRLQPGEALWFPSEGGVFHVKVPLFNGI